jgi:hypothetical protein
MLLLFHWFCFLGGVISMKILDAGLSCFCCFIGSVLGGVVSMGILAAGFPCFCCSLVLFLGKRLGDPGCEFWWRYGMLDLHASVVSLVLFLGKRLGDPGCAF